MAEPARSDTSRTDIALELRGVNKTFRQRQRSGRMGDIVAGLIRPVYREIAALRNIDLEVARGAIVAYAGPNGAGKSTTVKIASGMLVPDSGTVRVLGMDPVRQREAYMSRAGVVFGQRTELWMDHTVAASYDWKRVVWDIPRERYDRMLAYVLDVLGIAEFYRTTVRELSLGQRMRADLGMALLHEPDILFLDEPSLGLDVLAKRSMLDFIADLNRQRRVTVLVTSHDMAELEQLAGRIVMIHRGEIAFDGPFDQLRREFADRRVLRIDTDSPTAPVLPGATLTESLGCRHEYAFDAGEAGIAELLACAANQVALLDVETHRAPIDDVIANIYVRWQERSRQ
ncbi:MAG TPA: ATP-binding cassette domain-containing protein [Chthonomonadaceae bacterium]|nr:ATP-binding cassette domain-containing protein [Chthonomonadaceae bacterium]